MIVGQVEYERKYNLGDYEHETFKIVIHIENNTEVQQAVNSAKGLIERNKTRKNEPNGVYKP